MTTKTKKATKQELAEALAHLEPSVGLGLQTQDYWAKHYQRQLRGDLVALAIRHLDWYTLGTVGLSPTFTDEKATELLELLDRA